LSDQRWRYVSALMKWNGCSTSIGMTELLMRAALPDLDKPELEQHPDHLMGLQRRHLRHFRRRERWQFLRTQTRLAAHHLREASRLPRGGSPEVHPALRPASGHRTSPGPIQ